MEKQFASIAMVAVVAAFTCGIVIGFAFGYGAQKTVIKEHHFAADSKLFISNELDRYAEIVARNVAERACNEAKR